MHVSCSIDKNESYLRCKIQEQYLDALAVAVQAVVVGQCVIYESKSHFID